MKFHHNKKRNTALIYEILVQELTRTIIREDHQRRDTISVLFKKYFNKRMVLGKENAIYMSLSESKELSTDIFRDVLLAAKEQYKELDKKAIFNEQTKLISEVNKTLGKDVWGNFIKGYQWVATMNQLLARDNPPKKQVLLERKLIEYKTSGEEAASKSFPKVNNLAVKNFIQKFNDTYKSTLSESQRTILNKFILSSYDNGLELKACIYEELDNIKTGLSGVLSETRNKEVVNNVNKVLEKLDSYKEQKITERVIFEVLQMQLLVGELSTKCQSS
tara:strand:- start:1331 stop:2158 length:828 start_codon:yes stop_codon:yes gene_type:complete